MPAGDGAGLRGGGCLLARALPHLLRGANQSDDLVHELAFGKRLVQNRDDQPGTQLDCADMASTDRWKAEGILNPPPSPGAG